MMKKTGAGWLLFVIAGLLVGGSWEVRGDEAAPPAAAVPAPEVTAPAETEAPAEAAPAAAVATDFKERVQARVNALKALPVEEIEQAVQASEQAMQKLNTDAQAARFALRELEERMRLENPDVRAKYAELEKMRRDINTFIDELPEVKEKLEAANKLGKQLLEEAWFRTAAMQLVAEKDRAVGFPERPEPAVEEQPAPAPEAAPEIAPAAEAAPQGDLEP